MERVSAKAPGLVPWVCGINGYASVVGAVLASILAIHIGFTLVVFIALGLYALAGVNSPSGIVTATTGANRRNIEAVVRPMGTTRCQVRGADLRRPTYCERGLYA